MYENILYFNKEVQGYKPVYMKTYGKNDMTE